MARLPRFFVAGYPHHVIQRGNNREVIFVTDEDFRYYLEKLADASSKFRCEIHAYVLMTNHVHLLMTPRVAGGIGKVMQSLGRRYVRYFNQKYLRTGTLWEGRYRATLLDSDRYLLTCYRYIELNPVRAGMVSDPAEYPWSSYRFNAAGEDDLLVTPHALYRSLGTEDAIRRKNYRALFEKGIPIIDLEDIRHATNKAWVLGSERFQEQMEQLCKRRSRPKPRGGDRRSDRFRVAGFK